MAIGKNTPSATTATLEASPMPSQRISSGSRAILGIGKVAAMIGCTTASASAKNPTATPTLTPATAPTPKPQARRSRLVTRWTRSWPERAMSMPSASTPEGAGRKSADTQPVRVTSSHSTTIPSSASTRTTR